MAYGPLAAAWLKAMLAKGKPSGRWAKSDLVPEWPLELGTWYRTPFYKDDHLVDPVEPDTALCGRPLEPGLWDYLIIEAERHDIDIGPSHIYLSDRKGGKCTQCKNVWNDEHRRDALLREAGDSPEYIVMKPSKPTSRIAAHRLASKVAMVKRELGAVEEAA